MAALRWRMVALAAVGGGVLVAGLVVALAGSAEQCPDQLTQAQVDASDCIVGANIGLGLAWIFAVPFIMAVALWLGAVAWRRGDPHEPGE